MPDGKETVGTGPSPEEDDVMTEDIDYRLALAERADDLGRVLTQVGQSYELRPAQSAPNTTPEFISTDLAEIDQFLTRLEQGA